MDARLLPETVAARSCPVAEAVPGTTNCVTLLGRPKGGPPSVLLAVRSRLRFMDDVCFFNSTILGVCVACEGASRLSARFGASSGFALRDAVTTRAGEAFFNVEATSRFTMGEALSGEAPPSVPSADAFVGVCGGDARFTAAVPRDAAAPPCLVDRSSVFIRGRTPLAAAPRAGGGLGDRLRAFFCSAFFSGGGGLTVRFGGTRGSFLTAEASSGSCCCLVVVFFKAGEGFCCCFTEAPRGGGGLRFKVEVASRFTMEAEPDGLAPTLTLTPTVFFVSGTILWIFIAAAPLRFAAAAAGLDFVIPSLGKGSFGTAGRAGGAFGR